MGADRLVLHMGMGKTGSSALQVAFVQNRAQLAARGIHYPVSRTDHIAARGGVVSGNGMEIVEHVAPREDDPTEATRVLEAVRREVAGADGGTVLYSSEFLYLFRHTRLAEMRDVVSGEGTTVQAVVYVRDIAGHALSSYAQVVKRRLVTESFSDFVDSGEGQYRLDLQPRLQQLRSTLGAENVTVLHYDSEADALFAGFMRRVFGVTDLAGFTTEHGRVNRSLTRREVEWMRYMNRGLKNRGQARRLSNAMIKRPPADDSALSMTPQELEPLRERYGDEVAWVNDAFLADSTPLSVEGGVLVVDDAALGVEDATTRWLIDCLVDLVTSKSQAEGGKQRPDRASPGPRQA
ncbi:MAG: hypothetical protein ACXWW7_14865 [Nocardioides sp.]